MRGPRAVAPPISEKTERQEACVRFDWPRRRPRTLPTNPGAAYMVAHLSKAVGETGTVLAIDAEDAMIEYLSSRIEALGPATIMPQKVRPDDPHLQNDSVDAILFLDTCHHIGGRLDYAPQGPFRVEARRQAGHRRIGH